MPVYEIQGVSVEFPYEAYPCQIAYMDRVIDALHQRKNALLESPTGTGKTLCLLCATLAWRRFFEEKVKNNPQTYNGDVETTIPQVVYTSRTHSQLKQVAKELRVTSYKIKMAPIGSRQQLCLHKEVSKIKSNAAINMACTQLVKTRSCKYYHGADKNPMNAEESGVVDIEDLVTKGTETVQCPYYQSKSLHRTADLLLLPYNYLVSRKTGGLTIKYDNAIVIFDEAHNVASVCEDSMSSELRSNRIAAALSEVDTCLNAITQTQCDTYPETGDVLQYKQILVEFEKKLDSIGNVGKDGRSFPGDYVLKMLQELNITATTSEPFIAMTRSIAEVLVEEHKVGGGFALTELLEFIETVFSDVQPNLLHYRVHVWDEVKNTKTGNGDWIQTPKARVLSLWCFSGGVAMQKLAALNPRTILLTSGTLSPMTSFAEELSIEFPIQLENPHVIADHQIWVGVIPKGPMSKVLSSAYNRRSDPEYIRDLGSSLVNFSRLIPHGMLTFFPSYGVMNSCCDSWKNLSHQGHSVWSQIENSKPITVEPKQSNLLADAMNEFTENLEKCDEKGRAPNGATFMAVCRGKVSEGLDFADQNGRGVIITGIPYPYRMDPKVKLKQQYLNEMRGKLTGSEWYSQQAMRAVNQAVGRVIRHRFDFGAILLCDTRFDNANIQSQLSKWLRPHIRTYNNFGEVSASLSSFFRTVSGDKNVTEALAESQRKAKLARENVLAKKTEVDLRRAVVRVEDEHEVDDRVEVLSGEARKKLDTAYDNAFRGTGNFANVFNAVRPQKTETVQTCKLGSFNSAVKRQPSLSETLGCTVKKTNTTKTREIHVPKRARINMSLEDENAKLTAPKSALKELENIDPARSSPTPCTSSPTHACSQISRTDASPDKLKAPQKATSETAPRKGKEDAKQYLQEVRATLGDEKWPKFSQVLKRFHQDRGSCDNLVRDLHLHFPDPKHRDVLFRIIQFVPDNLKERFKQIF